MPSLYFENTKTGRKYRVLKLDKTANTITLEGSRAQFTEPYDKEKFAKMGYKLVQVEDEATEAA